jgi:succinate dehydrogenase/fumarate reductase flavoprotein subunit
VARGIPLEDMEMFQFHPTGLARLGVLLSEAARGEGGIVLNKDGERFMERYAPTIKDLAPRDMVSRAIYQEIKEGRGAGPNGDWAYLDISHLDPKVIEEKLPDITEFARIYLKVEPTTEPVPIQPTAHYAMGGIPTDTDGASSPARRGRDPRAVRRRRVRVRERPRRQPAGDELAARPRRVRRRAGDDAARHAKEASSPPCRTSPMRTSSSS